MHVIFVLNVCILYNHSLYLHECPSLVHSFHQPVEHFCPPVSWWQNGARQSSAETSSGHAPPPPAGQRGQGKRRKTKTKNRKTCMQVMEVDGEEKVMGWRMRTYTVVDTVSTVCMINHEWIIYDWLYEYIIYCITPPIELTAFIITRNNSLLSNFLFKLNHKVGQSPIKRPPEDSKKIPNKSSQCLGFTVWEETHLIINNPTVFWFKHSGHVQI